MAEDSFIAKAEVTINASAEKVWDALINPASVEQYMFGATVTSDWKEGSPVIWEGEWKGRTYKDNGQIVQVIPGAKLQYT